MRILPRYRFGRIVLWALIATSAGCSSIDWARLPERDLLEGIVSAPPFQAPLTIEVESIVAKSCEQVLSDGAPQSWIVLEAANRATLTPTNAGGSFGCTIEPAGIVAGTGRWNASASGNHWKVPIGVYSIDGTPAGKPILSRSRFGATRVNFAWTFHTYRKLQSMVPKTTAPQTEIKGTATAELARTDEGWKVTSIAMTPVQPR